MSFEAIGALFGCVFALTAGAVGGVVYAVRKTRMDDLSVRLAQIETDIAWIKATLLKLERMETEK